MSERCPVRSSVTDVQCELPDGHPMYNATRFHKFSPPSEQAAQPTTLDDIERRYVTSVNGHFSIADDDYDALLRIARAAEELDAALTQVVVFREVGSPVESQLGARLRVKKARKELRAALAGPAQSQGVSREEGDRVRTVTFGYSRGAADGPVHFIADPTGKTQNGAFRQALCGRQGRQFRSNRSATCTRCKHAATGEAETGDGE